MTSRQDSPSHESPTGHEPAEINIRGVLISVGGLAVLVVAALTSMYGLLRYFSMTSQPPLEQRPAISSSAESNTGNEPPMTEPRLQAHPLEDLRLLRAAEDETLNTYGWVNRDAGIARIPIQRAMQILAEKGLPTTQPREQP